jgi:polar amino acid transport system substrate-binding protein
MKRILTGMAVALILSATVATRAQETGLVPNFLGVDDVSGMENSESPGVIKFVTTLDYPPFNFLDASGRLNGFNVYLAKLICIELGIDKNCTVQAMPWEDLGPSLVLGQGNAIISGLAATEASVNDYAFSKPYLRIPARFVGNKRAEERPDFDGGLKGAKIGVRSASAYEGLARSYFPGAAVTGFASDELMLADLNSGKIDLAFGDGMRMAFWLSSQDNSGCCAFEGNAYYSTPYLGEGMRIAVSSDNLLLKKQIDHALIALQRKGKIEELYLRFFPKSFY